MKALTTTSRKVYHSEFGWLKQIKFFLFGFHFLTENHPIQEQIEEAIGNVYDLEDMAVYIEWRKKMKLMRLSNQEYEKVLTTKFIKQ